MCGIFALLNNSGCYADGVIEKEFMKGFGRGPEYSKIVDVQDFDKLSLGFHRLAINGLDSISHQPLFFKNVGIICNGEIYNYKELYKLVDTNPTTNSDCEVIIHLYLKFGIEHTLQLLDGVFAFVLADIRDVDFDWKIYTARDPYGVRPLYLMHSNDYDDYPIIFGSEMKMLHHFYENVPSKITGHGSCTLPSHYYKVNIDQFTPGTYSKLGFNKIHNSHIKGRWTFEFHNDRYSLPGFTTADKYLATANNHTNYEYRTILQKIHDNLDAAVAKRVANTDRPIACLLSGGLDSSLITGLVCKFNPIITEKVKTFSIGLAGSKDLKYAKQVSEFLNKLKLFTYFFKGSQRFL